MERKQLDENRDGRFGAPFRLGQAESHVLQAASIDGRYRIDLAVPPGPAPAAGWPLVLLLDAEGCFATCIEAVQRMGRRPDATGVRPLVVAGIRCHSAADAQLARRRDFTSADARQPGSGGAPAFLRFLAEEVLPLVESVVLLDRRQSTLFGHSLAGYFVLWVLANRPQLFRSYAAVSPSIWWDRDGLLAGLSGLSCRDRRALLLLGEWEVQLPPWQLAQPGHAEAAARRHDRALLSNAHAVAAVLRERLSGQARFELLADEDHASIVSAAIPRMLRLACGAGIGGEAERGAG